MIEQAQTYQLTQSQMLLWMGQQLTPHAPLYNMVFCFDFQDILDVAAFQLAFQKLLQECAPMRSVFIVQDTVPQQQVLSGFEYELEFLDWSNSKKDVQAWVEERSQQLFDLEKAAFDSVLLKISDNHFVWYLNQHHLITDAWSVTVMYCAMANYYQAALTNSLSERPTLPTFQNYIEYEKNSRAVAKFENFWKEKIRQVPRVLPKLYGFSGLETTSRSERVRVDLGKTRTEQLRTLAQEKDLRSWTVHASLFNIFLTTYFAFLYRISGQRNLAIGTPAHNRVKPEFKNTPGVFIELFPMLAKIEEKDTFSSLFNRVRTEVNGFLRYAQPGASQAELSRSFGAVLNYIHAHFDDFNGIPMQSKWIHAGHCDPRHHIRMQVYDFDDTGEIQVYFDLNKDVFGTNLGECAPQHFLNLLDVFIADRTQEIDAPQIATQAEAQFTVVDFNRTINPNFEPKSIVELFEQQVEKTPDAIALSFKGKIITYATLNAKANQLAHYLLQNKIIAGTRVAVHLKRSPELLISILGILKTGAAYIPIPSDLPPKRVEDMIMEGQVDLILTSENLAKRLDTNTETFHIDSSWYKVATHPENKQKIGIAKQDLAYVMFTSGSTGRPKGVMVSHAALSNYIQFAKQKYTFKEQTAFALFTMIGFDLTVTSLFTPLVSGGSVVIYEESEAGPDLALLEVMKDNAVDVIKLTPSHLGILKDKNWQESRIRCMIVGGEDFKAGLAKNISAAFPEGLKIYNEYGPTEATVGCIVHEYQAKDANKSSVPIGTSTPWMHAYVLDTYLNPVPKGLAGELYLSGLNLAEGYWDQEDLTAERFIQNPFIPSAKMYRTGDLARLNDENELEYLGRIDKQVKVGGIRVELGEIEAILATYPSLENVAVELWERPKKEQSEYLHYCNSCGLPSNYPNVEYDDKGICNFCNAFETYEQKAQAYFKNLDDLRAVFKSAQLRKQGEYDCIMLLSGGKDSTYALGQLVEMGYKVLAFTLDNGYISRQALDNVQRVADDLDVDCVVGTTPAMNEIFVDSLHRHCNVCNGCFKTIYTLATQIAVEKGIPIIVTGLSRGQFFETRLTEELFLNEKMDTEGIDQIILNARKEYHQVDDAVKHLMDTSIFDDNKVFEQIQFVDYYRYTDVSLTEMYRYLDRRLPWVRPTDTGRSTNCLINKLGIHVHTKTQGYSNYAFPYSWDVRMGHKERDFAIDEINEPIDIAEVQQMMHEIGYVEQEENAQELVAFYVAPTVISATDLRQHLAKYLPDYMIPTRFHRLDALPLTTNGKTDRKALRELQIGEAQKADYVAPSTQLEEMLVDLWQEILQIERVGVEDNFLELGGTSLAAIRLMARTNDAFELDLPLSLIFQKPTIAAFAATVEEILEELLADLEE